MNQQKPAVLITGATGGLGRKTAFALVKAGQNVIVHGRNRAAVDALTSELSATAAVQAEGWVADLADLTSVRKALTQLANRPLAGMVTNAGVSLEADERSAQGYEKTFAVNVLAHQVILSALVGQLVEGSRVVILSSGVHHPDNKLARRAGIPLPRWVGTRNLALPGEAEPPQRLADGGERYSTSKLGNILQARGLQASLREQKRDIDVFAIDPGLMVDTDLLRNQPARVRTMMRLVGPLITPFVDNMRLSKVSAGHITSLITDPKWHGQGFAYLDGNKVTPPSPDALDDSLVEEYWRESATLLGLGKEAEKR